MKLYGNLLKATSSTEGGSLDQGAPALALVSALRKLCNSPSILMQHKEEHCATADIEAYSMIGAWLRDVQIPERTVEMSGWLHGLACISTNQDLSVDLSLMN